IMFASMFGRTRVVEQLQAHGASLKRRNRFGVSAKWMVRLSHFWGRIFRHHQIKGHSATTSPQSL
ncbi:MAG: hypothetical protein ABSF34_15620, partial [Verrucomicrobiota bacterium]